MLQAVAVKTGKEIGLFSLLTLVIALICENKNLDESQALLLLYTGTLYCVYLLPAAPLPSACFVPAPSQVLSHSSHLLSQLSVESSHTCMNTAYTCGGSVLNVPAGVHFWKKKKKSQIFASVEQKRLWLYIGRTVWISCLGELIYLAPPVIYSKNFKFSVHFILSLALNVLLSKIQASLFQQNALLNNNSTTLSSITITDSLSLNKLCRFKK